MNNLDYDDKLFVAPIAGGQGRDDDEIYGGAMALAWIGAFAVALFFVIVPACLLGLGFLFGDTTC